MRKIGNPFILGLALFLGVALGVGATQIIAKLSGSTVEAYPIRESGSAYQFIHPLIGLEIGDKKDFLGYVPLEQKIEAVIAEYKRKGIIDSVGVYFRDLESAKWTGVNEDEKFAPASLYKTGLMIAYLKQAENDPTILDRKIYFKESREQALGTPDYPPIIPGQYYTVKQLIEHLIINSDNDAKDLLHDNMDQRYVNEVFTDLGLESPDTTEVGDSMSAKAYSRFFRTLYSSTYLSRTMSELALSILSKAKFNEGLVAGVPSGVVVAHKYGFRILNQKNIGEGGANMELHDCGIVYAESTTYFLCVMTKGWNPIDLKEVIASVSKATYEEIGKK